MRGLFTNLTDLTIDEKAHFPHMIGWLLAYNRIILTRDVDRCSLYLHASPLLYVYSKLIITSIVY